MKITTFTRGILVFLFLISTSVLSAESQKILITEIMAINSNGLVDEDNEHSDWIEIYNNTANTIDLAGWYLTDIETNLKEWQFPSVTIAKGAYMVIFASGKDRTDPTKTLHTNFKLSGSGEFLAICEPDTTISYSFSPAFPAQRQDISYGLYQGKEVYFTLATPGSENMAGSLPFTPVFSQTRGFFDAAFDLSLTAVDQTDKIYYTLDGTRPTKSNANLYSAPIHISKTTPVSAITVDADGQSSEIISNTFIFPEQVFQQSKTQTGYPSNWGTLGNSTPASDYEMDSRVTGADAYKNRLMNALKSLPSVNVVTNIGYLFSKTPTMTEAGIYVYTGLPSYKLSDGTSLDAYNLKYPTSVEYFDPKTGKEFQLNCQLKLHGGNGRRPTNSPKHGFEFGFKSKYGPSKLNFDIFEENNSVKEFNTLILRPTYNNSWTKNSTAQQQIAQYVIDPWAKNLQLLMNHDAGHERFIHLYLNGLYWGVYNITEQLDAVYMGDYMKGSEAEFDVIRGGDTSATDGDMNAWNSLKSAITSVSSNTNYQKIQGKNPDGTVNTTMANLLDVDNYIDYMLINYYMGNLDWKNNWTVARNRVQNISGFRFFCWDTENSMVNLTDEKVSSNDGGNPNSFIKYLMDNDDFKTKFADRVQKEFLTANGLFNPATVAGSYIKLADEVQEPLILESARWSDWYAPYNPYTVDDDWMARKDFILNTYFPQRADIVVEQLKSAGYFPTVEAPVFSNNGGVQTSAINLGMSSNAGTIYYTTDGSDPRTSITGVVASTAKTYSTEVNIGTDVTIKARAKTSSEWSPIAEVSFSFTNAVETPMAELLACAGYPNPFDESTRIQFTLPYNGNVQVDIYSLDGRLVEQLYNGNAESGLQYFDWKPETSGSGIYICCIIFEGQSSYLKLIRK